MTSVRVLEGDERHWGLAEFVVEVIIIGLLRYVPSTVLQYSSRVLIVRKVIIGAALKCQ